jgi:hypothetical protein
MKLRYELTPFNRNLRYKLFILKYNKAEGKCVEREREWKKQRGQMNVEMNITTEEESRWGRECNQSHVHCEDY